MVSCICVASNSVCKGFLEDIWEWGLSLICGKHRKLGRLKVSRLSR